MATKAQLAQLEIQLADAVARLAEVEGGSKQPTENHLVQTLWLGREVAAQGVSQGGIPWVRISGQYADRKPGESERQWGAYKSLVAFSDNAKALLDIYSTGVRLVRIAMHEEPGKPTPTGQRVSSWVIEQIAPVGKPPVQEAQPAPAPEAGYGEPTDEEVAF